MLFKNTAMHYSVGVSIVTDVPFPSLSCQYSKKIINGGALELSFYGL